MSERILLPSQQPEAVLHRIDQYRGAEQSRQIEVLCEIIDKLPNRDVIASPQRHAVQLHAQTRGREARDQELVVA
jgi:hypothetical protein